MINALRALVLVIVLGVALPSAASAANDPGGFHFLNSNLTVSEADGAAVIKVTRANTDREAHVQYIAVGPGHRCGSQKCTAQYKWDFSFKKGSLDFPAGVATETFSVPVVDHHAASAVHQTFQVSLFAAYPVGKADPSTATVTILNNDPLSATATGVGGVPGAPVIQLPVSNNPLALYRFFVDPERPLIGLARRHHSLKQAAAQPWVERFGEFSGKDVGQAVAHYLARASVEQPGTVPELSTYEIVHKGAGVCGRQADSAGREGHYENFMQRFAGAIGSYHAVLFLEMDSLITASCLSHTGYQIRIAELNYAIAQLTLNCPNLVIYLDAGAADALPASTAADRLKAAGVAKIQGFFLNSTHYDWTLKELRYGQKIASLTGGKHFVVSTSMNGQGPLIPRNRVRDGNEVLCNPVGRGLGPLPTANTGYANADGFAWILHPGESTGPCGAGAPATGVIWTSYLLGLRARQNLTIR